MPMSFILSLQTCKRLSFPHWNLHRSFILFACNFLNKKCLAERSLNAMMRIFAWSLFALFLLETLLSLQLCGMRVCPSERNWVPVNRPSTNTSTGVRCNEKSKRHVLILFDLFYIQLRKIMQSLPKRSLFFRLYKIFWSFSLMEIPSKKFFFQNCNFWSYLKLTYFLSHNRILFQLWIFLWLKTHTFYF